MYTYTASDRDRRMRARVFIHAGVADLLRGQPLERTHEAGVGFQSDTRGVLATREPLYSPRHYVVRPR